MLEYPADYDLLTSNTRIKIYPCGIQQQVSNRSIFSVPGTVTLEKRKRLSPDNSTDQAHARQVALSRARCCVRDIALCAGFTHFLTLTFDRSKIDRFSRTEVQRVLTTFLKNKSRRNGFRYVAVPELHKDGAIHVHCLCTPGSCKLQRAINPNTGSPISVRGRPAYNLLDWKWGFSSCIPIDGNYARTVNYVTKYIGKSSEKVFGKWYFSSRNIEKKPEIQLVSPVFFSEFCEAHPETKPFSIYGEVKMVSLWNSFPSAGSEVTPG